MFYICRSLVFLFVWMLLQITAVHIHQDMISARKESQRTNLNRGGVKEDTTTAVPCPALVSKNYTLVDGTKWMKLSENRMNVTTCELYCDQDGTRLATIKSRIDRYALTVLLREADVSYSWVGCRQTSRTTYEWSDGTRMTVDLNDGSTDLDLDFELFVTSSGYDKAATQVWDSHTCLYFDEYEEALADGDCTSDDYCTCECKN